MSTKVAGTKLISRPETEIDASDLLIQRGANQSSDFIEEVELRPGEQGRIFLGVFKSNDTPKGFCVLHSPNEVDEEEIIKQIAKLDLQDEQYELILHIANYGSKVVSAEVRRLT